MEELQLVPIQNVDAVALFVNGGIDEILKNIEGQVSPLVFDVTTARGRKDCASVAYKVAQSKTYLDNLGKDLVSDWKNKSKKVDADRKRARDFLDELKEKVRAPLTAFEQEEAARAEAERIQKEFDAAHADALNENDLFDRQKEIERKEAEFARIEAERRAKEEAERIAKERQEREARIAAEAAERARREAEEDATRKREALEREKRDAEARALKSEQDRIVAEARAKAEQEAAVRMAEERARVEAERKERERLAAEAKAKADAERAAKNKAHRQRICKEILADLQGNGISPEVSVTVLDLVDTGKIRNMKIEY